MKPMVDAPKSRAILLRLTSGPDQIDQFIVGQYAVWGGSQPYFAVWETAPGECVRLDDEDLIGWYELPE